MRLPYLLTRSSDEPEETAKSVKKGSGLVGDDELGKLFEWGQHVVAETARLTDRLNERDHRVRELSTEIESLVKQVEGITQELNGKNAKLWQAARKLDAKQAELDKAGREHDETIHQLVLGHSRELGALETRLNNEKRHLQSQLLVSSNKSQSWPDEKLRTQFCELCRIIDNTTATISTTVDIPEQGLGRRLDPEDSLGLVKGRVHFWLRSRVWSILQSGFFALPFGFGAFGPDRGAAEMMEIYRAWRSRLDGSTDSAANRWRSVTFQTLAASVAEGGPGAAAGLVRLGHDNVTHVGEQVISLLSAIAAASRSPLQGGLQGEIRAAASLAFELALQCGVNPARLVLLTAERSQTVAIGASHGYVDCEDGEERRGDRVQVAMVASPGLQRIGDGRSETTQKHTITRRFHTRSPSLLCSSNRLCTRVMAGLWDVPTRCIEPGKGVLIWLWLATAGLAMITACSILCVPSCWKITRLLHAGMVLLSVYFVLHCIDFTIQQAGVEVTYGYIFFQSFNTVWRTLSDILLLCGFWLTVNRFRTPNVTIGKGGLIIAGTLWVLGLYKLGLQFALCFAWLGFVDLKTIDSIAAARSGFDVGFAALYFAVTFMAMAILVGDDEEFLSPREPFKHEGPPHLE
ncbi:hypothetical protein ACJ41O_013105 [Fusarium nematophilum]